MPKRVVSDIMTPLLLFGTTFTTLEPYCPGSTVAYGGLDTVAFVHMRALVRRNGLPGSCASRESLEPNAARCYGREAGEEDAHRSRQPG